MDECIESDIVFKWTYFCRLCLTSNATINIFESEETSKDIITNLQTELNLLAYAGDPMPQKLCSSCAEQLTSWQKFKQKCIESDEALKKRLVPFKSLDFVRTYLEKTSVGTGPTKKDAENSVSNAFPFPVMAVKQEPMEDSPAKDTGISSGCASEVTDPGQSSLVNTDNQSDRGRDWSDHDDNSADTVFDDPAADNTNSSIGLDILRQMIGEVGKTNVDKEPADTVSFNEENEAQNQDMDDGMTPLGFNEVNMTQPQSQSQNDNMEVDTLPEPNVETTATVDVRSDSTNSNNVEASCVNPMIGVVRIENLTESMCQAGSTSSQTEPLNGPVAPVMPIAIMGLKVKEEPGSPMQKDDSKKYNLRRRREANYEEEDEEWHVEKRRAPAAVQRRLTPWKCEVCNIYFSSYQILIDHHSSDSCIGTQMDCFSCLICAKKFLSENSLAEHNLKHLRVAFNISVDELGQCSKCDMAFADPWRLKQHSVCHAQKSIPSQANQYTCHDCGLIFIKRAKYEEHKKSHAIQPVRFEPMELSVTPERDYGCSLCIARFKSEDFLYDHRFAVHGIADERVVCTTCGVKFRDESSLAEHMLSHRSKATARKTTNPFFKITNLRTLEKEPQSLGGGSVRCRRCGVVFSSQEELVRHEALKHKNLMPYSCRKCNRRFSTRSLLLMHHREHAGPAFSLDYKPIIEQPVAPNEPLPSNSIVGMSCVSCQVKFMTEVDLEEHVESHRRYGSDTVYIRNKNDPCLLHYQCRQCPLLFARDSSGEKHSINKHNGSPFLFHLLEVPVRRNPALVCLKCDTSFNCQAALNFHIKIKHPAEADPPNSSGVGKTSAEPQKFPGRTKCRYCSKICNSTFNLRSHEAAHSRPFKCRFCSEVFSRKYGSKNFYKHETKCKAMKSAAVAPPTPPHSAPPVDAVLSNAAPIKCTVCGNVYDTVNLLELHTMTAHGLVSLKPAVALEKELWQEEDNKIVREVGGRQKCTLCQIELDNGDAGWHRSQHPRGNLYILQIDDSLFQCTVCDRIFSNRSEAMLHASEHSQPDIKPQVTPVVPGTFNCPFCTAMFSSEDSIRSHIFFAHPSGSSNSI